MPTPTKEKQKKEIKMTPQQLSFIAYYTDPKSETYSNALQSGLKAGYSREYSESITVKGLDWLADYGGMDKHQRMLAKAERNMEEIIDMPTQIPGTQFHQKDLIRVKADMTKFIGETIGKKTYSKKVENSFNFDFTKGNAEFE